MAECTALAVRSYYSCLPGDLVTKQQEYKNLVSIRSSLPNMPTPDTPMPKPAKALKGPRLKPSWEKTSSGARVGKC